MLYAARLANGEASQPLILTVKDLRFRSWQR